MLNGAVKRLRGNLIQISTNCVFSHSEQPRDEFTFPNPKDIYGLSKFLGEPPDATILRTSIIGEELNSNVSLLNWVLSQKESVQGYTNHYWNGVTCLQLAKYIDFLLSKKIFWSGVRHIYSNEILSKKDLLELICRIYNHPIQILENSQQIPVTKLLSSQYPMLCSIPSLEIQIQEQKNFFKEKRENPILHTLTEFKDYQLKTPFPHGIQDSFLEEAFAKKLQTEILSIPKDAFDRYENPFESKYTLRDKYNFPPLLKQVFDTLQSQEFLKQLSSVVGTSLQLDTERLYWGVHLYDTGDKLDIHTDAGIHPILGLKKHCTLGIYLSKNYKEEQGCHLELWKGTSCLQNPVLEEKFLSIPPLFNRMILFTCTDKAWHGNPEPLKSEEATKRIFITISYLSEDTTLINTYKKALFIKRPQDPEDKEKDRLRQLRANPDTCKEIYRTKH